MIMNNASSIHLVSIVRAVRVVRVVGMVRVLRMVMMWRRVRHTMTVVRLARHVGGCVVRRVSRVWLQLVV